MKYKLLFIITLCCMISCIKVSSTTSNVGNDIDLIYTVGDIRQQKYGEFIPTLVKNIDVEANAVVVIKDLLGISTQISSDDLLKSMTKQQMLDAFYNKAKNISDKTTLYWFYIGHGFDGKFWTLEEEQNRVEVDESKIQQTIEKLEQYKKQIEQEDPDTADKLRLLQQNIKLTAQHIKQMEQEHADEEQIQQEKKGLSQLIGDVEELYESKVAQQHNTKNNNYVSLDEIMTTIQKVRNTPFKKLVIFTVACTSGEIYRNLRNYEGKVFEKAIVFSSGTSEESRAGRFLPSVYTALNFLKTAQTNPEMSISDIIKATNEYKRFSGKEVKEGCPLIKFNKSGHTGTPAIAGVQGVSRKEECDIEKEPVTISSRENPTYDDLYKLINYLSTNEDNKTEVDFYQYPQIFAYPNELRYEPIWED